MRMRPKLAVARAYYRLAAKSFKAGSFQQSAQYRRIAERLVNMDRREQEARARKG